MEVKEPVYFDLKNVALLREVLDNARTCLRPERRASMSRRLLAERVLKTAAQGERHSERLLNANGCCGKRMVAGRGRRWPF